MGKLRDNLGLLAIVSEGFLSRLSFGLVSFALPLYARRLGMSLAEIGLLLSLPTLVSFLCKPLMGWGADRCGRKRGFLGAMMLRNLEALLLAFAAVPWHIFLLRIMHGAAASLRDVSGKVLLAEHGDGRKVATAFAWHQTAKSVAGTLGKASSGILLAWTGSNYDAVFVLAFVLSSLPIVFVARYVQEPDVRPAYDNKTAAQTRSEPPGLPSSSKEERRTYAALMGMGFLVSATANMLHGLFPVLATDYAGLNEAQAGTIYLLSGIAALFGGPAFGWLSDNFSRRLVLLTRGTANTLSSIIYIVAPTFAGMATGRVVDDLGKVAFRPAWGSVMAEATSSDRARRATRMSILSMADDAGQAVGPALAGLLWNAWGAVALLLSRTALALLTEFYATAVVSGLEKKTNQRSAENHSPQIAYDRTESQD